ncbi:MAG: hypothetical protein AB8E15_13225 [Bdellovibrionales bacterium]
MKNSWILLVLLLSYGPSQALDLEAIISYPLSSTSLEIPENCSVGLEACIVKSPFFHKTYLHWNSSKFTLGSESSVKKNVNGQISFLAGELWLETDLETDLYIESGKFLCQNCKVFLERQKDTVLVRTIAGKVFFQPKRGERIQIPIYYQNWVGNFNVKTNSTLSGVPRPIAFVDHVRKWSRIYPKTKSEFREEVRSFRKKWAYTVHDSSKMYKKIITRKVASAIQKEQSRKAAKKKRLESTRYYRELLRKRAFTQ